MSAIFSRVSGKWRTTIPKPVREVLRLRSGGTLIYRIEGNTVVLAGAEPLDRAWLAALESTLSEWASREDAAAYDGL